MNKLYEIWHVGHTTYSMKDTLSVSTYTRDQVVSPDSDKLQEQCDYLNHICDDDEYYEVRESNTNERI